MKNKILYLITMVLFALNSIQAQSKNEQILVLTNKIDTLNGIIIKENLKLDSLNIICLRKSVMIDSLIGQISLFRQTIKENIEKIKLFVEQLKKIYA
jgi:hypothetical protein